MARPPIVSALTLLLSAAPALAQCFVQKIDASDGGQNDELASAVDVDGATAVVGAPGDDDFGPDSGSVYVFERVGDTWVETARLNPAEATTRDRFGFAVAISGDVIVAGAPLVDGKQWDRQGEAYVFERDAGGPDNWGQVATLTFDADFRDLNFGGAVAIDGDTIVVGMRFDGGTLGDMALVYRRDAGGPDNWGQVAAIDGPPDTDDFGRAVSIDGDLVAIGADTDDGGSVHVHERDREGPEAWGLVVSRTGSDTAPGDHFADAVAIEGETLLVGAWGRDEPFGATGAAYVFRRDAGGADNWGEVRRIVPSDADLGLVRAFGSSVGLDGDFAVIGARADDERGSNAGAVYACERGFGGPDHWGERQKYLAFDATGNERFGGSVAIDGDVSIVGAHFADVEWNNDGAAYLYHGVPDRDCNDNGVCDLVDVAEGTSDDCNENGTPDECDIAEGTSEDCSGNRVPDECEPDCNDNGIADSCDILEGTSDDCNANDVPDECEAFEDCNDNGIPDECDIDGGESKDCNENGVPDECDIENGTSIDCNTDGVPDECTFEAWILPKWQNAEASFGRAVAVSGTRALVGAGNDGLEQGGVVNVFEREDFLPYWWFDDARLRGEDTEPEDDFGFSVALDGRKAVIGAPEHGFFEYGAAYVFERQHSGAWWQVAKLVAVPERVSERFGHAVAVDLNTIVVGANHPNGFGAAYVFQRNIFNNSWEFRKKIGPDDPEADARFGHSVAVDGDLIAVGAERHGDFAQGAVYLFARDQGGNDNWGQIRKLTAPDAGLTDQLGRAVGASGDTVIAGAPGAEAVYIFERDYDGPDAWGLVARRTAPGGNGGDLYGNVVAIDGDLALVGARGYEDIGATYVLQRHFGGAGAWSEMLRLTAFNAREHDAYGGAVTIDGPVVVVGAPVAGANDEGAAYGYELQPCTQCPTDVDQDGDTGFADLLLLLSTWGDCPDDEPCPADVDVNGRVDFDDLLALLAAWGPC